MTEKRASERRRGSLSSRKSRLTELALTSITDLTDGQNTKTKEKEKSPISVSQRPRPSNGHMLDRLLAYRRGSTVCITARGHAAGLSLYRKAQAGRGGQQYRSCLNPDAIATAGVDISYRAIEPLSYSFQSIIDDLAAIPNAFRTVVENVCLYEQWASKGQLPFVNDHQGTLLRHGLEALADVYGITLEDMEHRANKSEQKG